MNIVDAIVIIILLAGLVVGFKRGVIKQTVKFLGSIGVIVGSVILKTPVAMFLSATFPFIKFNGLSSLNILLYEVVAFVLVLIILTIIFKLLCLISGWIEKLFKATIILSIPSKILGAIVGLFEAYLVVFVLFILLSSPIFNFKLVNDSKSKDFILNKTPILSILSENIVNTFEEVWELRNSEEKDNLDQKIYEILMENKIINKETIDKMIESGKINLEEEE